MPAKGFECPLAAVDSVARIVRGVHVIYSPRPEAAQLDHRFLLCPHVLGVAHRDDDEAPRGHGGAFGAIQFVAQADVEGAREDRDVFERLLALRREFDAGPAAGWLLGAAPRPRPLGILVAVTPRSRPAAELLVELEANPPPILAAADRRVAPH